MAWSSEKMAELAHVLRRLVELSEGDRAQRLEAERWEPAVLERFREEVDDGSLPLAVLDALLAEDDLHGYLAAGPVEDLLDNHPSTYGVPIAERARQDPRWSAALGGAIVAEHALRLLPAELRRRLSPMVD